MAKSPNEFHLIWFDPGSAATGFAHLVIDYRAFSRPENKVLRWLKSWECGEITGDDHAQYKEASARAYAAHFLPKPFVARVMVGSEGHILKQTVGSAANLLSPVRFNAVLSWEVSKHGLELVTQNPSERVHIKDTFLYACGFTGWPRNRWVRNGRGKDAFAAMQHAVLRLRRIKADANKHPWKLGDETSANAYWDCACSENIHYECDLRHT